MIDTNTAVGATAPTVALNLVVGVNLGDIVENRTIPVELSAEGGTSPYMYTVAYRSVYDDGTFGNWVYVQYQLSNSFVTFSVPNSGRYQLYCAVVDSSNSVKRDYQYFYVYSETSSLDWTDWINGGSEISIVDNDPIIPIDSTIHMSDLPDNDTRLSSLAIHALPAEFVNMIIPVVAIILFGYWINR